MTKNELIERIASRTGVSVKDAAKVIDTAIGITKDELANGGEVKLVDFGTFSISNKRERKGRDPRTGEEITIPAHKSPVFKPGKNFKAKVNA